MDRITNAKAEFRRKQWTQIIQTCQTSGMRAATWCAQNDVNIKSYYYWLRKFRTAACDTSNLLVTSNEQQIVPLPFKQAKTSSAITINMTTVSIEINDGTSRATIEAVLLALKNIC